MENLQEIFERQLRAVPKLVISEIIRERLVAEGIQIDDELLRQFVEHIFSGNNEPFIHQSGDDSITHVVLKFSNEEIVSIERKCESFVELLPDLIEKTANSAVKILKKTLGKQWANARRARLEDKFIFERRLEKRWSKPLSRLQMLLDMSLELGNKCSTEHLQRDATLSNVLVRLHVRACQVTGEILTLLRSGFADGAMARWRTLHEIGIVATLIGEHGSSLAERYIAHQAVEAKAGMEQFELCYEKLGYSPLSDRERGTIDYEYQQVITTYGKDFRTPYGWAVGFIPKNRRGNIGLAELEAAAGRSALASHYKLASHNIHAGPHALFFRLGLIDNNLLLAGPSNAGLSEPGQNAAVTLAQITMTTVIGTSTLDDIVNTKILGWLSQTAVANFADVEANLKSEHQGSSTRSRTR